MHASTPLLKAVAGLLLGLGCWVTAAAATRHGLPYFETVPGTERIANGIITSVAQDRRGLMWLGSTEGLHSFDGYQLRSYRHDPDDPNTLGDDYIRALLPHSDGSLWVATQAAGLSIYDPASDQFRRLPASAEPCALPSNATVALAEDRDGSVWVGLGMSGLAHWQPDSACFVHHPPAPGQPDAVAHDTVRTLLVDRAGDLWLGSGSGLQRRRAGSQRFEAVASEANRQDGFHRQYVYGLLQASDGRLWIATQANGIGVLDPAGGALVRVDAGPDGVSHPWVSGFAEPRPNEIWVFTYGGGIDIIDAPSATVVRRLRADLSIPGGLALNRLVVPFTDHAGMLWIGTWGAGLQRHNPLNGDAFVTLRASATDDLGLRSADIFSTLPDGPRRLWLGTSDGLDLFDLDDGLLRSYRAEPEREGGLRDGTIRALARTTDGTLWVGTQQAGLQRYRPDSDNFANSVQTLRRGPIRRLLAGSDGSLWVGLQAGLARIAPGQTDSVALERAAGAAFTEAVWALAEDPEGRIWASTPSDLYLWQASDPVLRPIASETAPLRALTDLQIGPEGMLWGSGPRGIARLTGWIEGRPQFEDYGRRLGALPQGLGQQLLFDDEGRLWGPKGTIDTRTDQLREIGIADGVDIGSLSTGSASRLDGGLLVFGGTRGLLLIDPTLYRPWQFDPPLLAQSVDIDGQSRWLGDPSAGITLQAGERRFSVGFAALDYSAPHALSYAYRLDGLEANWNEVGADRRVATYNNLWPDHYQLQIRVRDRSGQWGEPLLIPVDVLPAWWQTHAAMLLAIVALVGLTWVAVRWRTWQIQHRNAQLEQLVAQRTGELRGAKERAEAALHNLRGAQQQLVAAEKMASLGQLVAGVAHEINTPIGIAVTAASHLEEVTRKSAGLIEAGRLSRSALGDWQTEVQQGSQLISRSLERAAALVASFKQVSVDQSSDQRRQFELAAYLEEVRVALQPMLRRTTHRFEIDCQGPLPVDTFPGALFQIITNLLANALTHAFEPGQHGEVRLKVEASGEQLCLRFSDDGRGMDDPTRERAFDPFFTTRRGSGGSGLGLNIVHNLVTQLLGGSIELTSSPGRGTRFTIRIPSVAPQRNPASA